jgi:excisionase family DNA binding protein
MRLLLCAGGLANVEVPLRRIDDDDDAANADAVNEAAQYLGRPPKTLQTWRHEGRGPRSARVGGRVVYDREDLDAWVDAEFTRTARAQPTSDGGARRAAGPTKRPTR